MQAAGSHTLTAGRNGTTTLRNNLSVSLKVKSAAPFLGFCPSQMKTSVHMKTYMQMSVVALFEIS